MNEATPVTETPVKKERRRPVAFKAQLRAAALIVAPNVALDPKRMTHNARAWARNKGYAVAKGRQYYLTTAGAYLLGWTDETPVVPRQSILRRALNAARSIFA